MPDTHQTLRDMYAAFNRRDIEAALTLMADIIDWPKASEGGRVIGKPEIRAYWTRQWAEFNPTVTSPLPSPNCQPANSKSKFIRSSNPSQATSSPTGPSSTPTPSPTASSPAWTSPRTSPPSTTTDQFIWHAEPCFVLAIGRVEFCLVLAVILSGAKDPRIGAAITS